MSKQKTYVVVSLGQLVGANIWGSIGEFANILSDKWGMAKRLAHPFCYVATCCFYAYDHFYKGNIAKFKLGHIKEDAFFKYLSGFFGGNTTKLKKAWNKVCDGKDSIKNVESLETALKNNTDLHVIVVGHTNKTNVDCVERYHFEGFGYKDRIQYQYSYIAHNADLNHLASLGFTEFARENNKLDAKFLISCHRAIDITKVPGVEKEKCVSLSYNHKVNGLFGAFLQKEINKLNNPVITKV